MKNYPSLADIPIQKRSQGRKMIGLNAFLWGMGNGLIGTSLLIYVIIALTENQLNRAQTGLAIAWIIAAPRIIGLSRIFTPALIDRMGNRKILTVLGYVLSPLVLLAFPLGIPLLSQWDPVKINQALLLIGVIWAVYHLIEYMATVTLWSWLGDFITPKIRSRFLAKRERLMIAGQLLGRLGAGLYSYHYYDSFKAIGETWRAYLFPVYPGIILLLAAALPILWIPEIQWKRSLGKTSRFKQFLIPLRSKKILSFLLFGCWIQIAGGISQSPQSFYLSKILGITFLTALLLESGTRIGQISLSKSVGSWIERFGNEKTMAFSLAIVSLGSLCYAAATPQTWGFALLAALIWIGWIGVNLGINNLVLSLPQPNERTSFIAFFFAMTTLSFGLSTMLGGWLSDQYRDRVFSIPFLLQPLTYYQVIFIISFFARFAGIFFLLSGWKDQSSSPQ